MKTAIVFSVFVLVASLRLQANAAVYRGYSKDCKIPESIANTCHRYECTNDEYTVSTCGFKTIGCPPGEVTDPGQEDLTKEYPDCCPQRSCHKE